MITELADCGCLSELAALSIGFLNNKILHLLSINGAPDLKVLFSSVLDISSNTITLSSNTFVLSQPIHPNSESLIIYSTDSLCFCFPAMAETPRHFFKVILASTLEDKKLRIPEKFVRRFEDELSAFATLAVPNGRVWRVGLSKDGGKIWFHDGWDDFIKYHSIRVGYFLVFKYEKKSKFHIFIFDHTTCEIRYPYNFEEPKNEQDSIHEEDAANLDSSSSQIKGERDLLALLEEKGISLSRNYRFYSSKERKRIFNVAESLKPRNPSFMIFMRPSHMKSGVVYLPAKFANKYLTLDIKCLRIQVSDGRELAVEIGWTNGSCHTKKRWPEFVSSYLKAGDICVFELIRMVDLLLKVSVF